MKINSSSSFNFPPGSKLWKIAGIVGLGIKFLKGREQLGWAHESPGLIVPFNTVTEDIHYTTLNECPINGVPLQ